MSGKRWWAIVGSGWEEVRLGPFATRREAARAAGLAFNAGGHTQVRLSHD
jgi:hypothetical protein